MNPLARYFANGAVVLVLTALASTFSGQRSSSVVNGSRDAGEVAAAAFEFVDDRVLDPIVRHLSRRAIVAGESGTRLSGLLGEQKDGQLVIETPDGVVHEIIGAQDRTGANDPALLAGLAPLVGKTVTVTGFLDPVDPLPAKDFVAWRLIASSPAAPATPSETVGAVRRLGVLKAEVGR